jgi:hypothetical protein
MTYTFVLIGLMLLLSLLQTRGKDWWQAFKATPVPVPDSSSGD